MRDRTAQVATNATVGEEGSPLIQRARWTSGQHTTGSMIHMPGRRTIDVNSRSSGLQAFANLLKCMIGSGILTLPFVTGKVGLAISLPGLALIAYMTQEAIRYVVRCAAHQRLLQGQYVDLDKPSESPMASGGMEGGFSWQLVANAAFGRPGVALTTMCLAGAQLGVVASYLNLVASTLMLHWTGLTVLQSRLGLWVGISSLCMLRPLKSVAVVSAFALCVYAVIFVLVGYYGMHVPPRLNGSATLTWFAPAHFGSWFGPAIFAFEGAGPALSIYESMGTTDVRPFFRVLTVTYLIAVLLYGYVAAAGYVAWGNGVASILIDSFPPTLLGSGSRTLLAIIIALTYPIQVSPALAHANVAP